jgi:hypothetical protein
MYKINKSTKSELTEDLKKSSIYHHLGALMGESGSEVYVRAANVRAARVKFCLFTFSFSHAVSPNAVHKA